MSWVWIKGGNALWHQGVGGEPKGGLRLDHYVDKSSADEAAKSDRCRSVADFSPESRLGCAC